MTDRLDEIKARRTRAMSAMLHALRVLPPGEIRAGCVIDTRDRIKDALKATIIDDVNWLVAELEKYRSFANEEKCSSCEGSGLMWSGAEYAGIREYVACFDCEGTGVGLGGVYPEIRRLRAESASQDPP